MAFLLPQRTPAGPARKGQRRRVDELSPGRDHPPPNLRKVIVDLSGRPDYTPNVECENGYSLLGVVLRSDAIGIVSANSDALHLTRGELVRLTIEGLAEDLEERYTRYGIVSRAGYRLSPLAEAMIEQIKQVDEQDDEVCSLENFAV